MARVTARCEACGVTLPPGAVRCPTCGHSKGEAIAVEVGRPRNRGRSRRDHVVVGAALALLLGTLVLAGRNSKSTESAEAVASSTTTSTTSTTVQRTTTSTIATTTTTTTLPGRQLGAPSGVRLLLSSTGAVYLLDVDTGKRDMVPLAQEYGGLVPRTGGVVVQTGAGIEFVAEPYTGPHVRIATGGDASVYPSTELDRVWVANFDSDGTTLREVDTNGQVTAGPFEAPAANSNIVGAVHDGIVGSVHGAIFVIDRSGASRRIGTGDAIAAGGDTVIASTCDDRLRCDLIEIDVPTGRTRALDAPDAEPGYPQGSLSPDGSTAAVFAYRNGSLRLQVIDLVTGTSHTLDPTLTDNGPASVTFSPDSQWLFFVAGGEVYAQHAGDPSLLTIDAGGERFDFVIAL